MRKVVYGVGISLDGYLARPDGSVDFLFMPKDDSMAPFFQRIDVAAMGRKTYEKGLELSDGSMPGMGGMKYFVFSKSQPGGERGGVTFVKESPREWLEAVRKKKGKDIWLMGGGELTRDLLKDDLLDEIYLGVVPRLIGEGIPAFASAFPQRDFKLVENKTFSKGLVALRYERVRAKRIR